MMYWEDIPWQGENVDRGNNKSKRGRPNKSDAEKQFLDNVLGRMEAEADTTGATLEFVGLMGCRRQHAYDVFSRKVSPTVYDIYHYCLNTGNSADYILGINNREDDGEEEITRIYNTLGTRDKNLALAILRAIAERNND